MSLSSQPRRAFYSVLSICQAVIFRSFSFYRTTSTTCASINLLRCSSAGGEFYSVTTVCQTLFSHRFDQPDRRHLFADLTAKTLQLIESEGFFVSVCAGSGANYREINSPVNPLFQKTVIKFQLALTGVTGWEKRTAKPHGLPAAASAG